MVHHRNWIILAAVVFTLIAFNPFAQAGPPLKEDNPGLPGCLAKVNQLEQTIADQQATIVGLQEQIATLNASLKYKLPKTGQQKLDDSPLTPGDDGELQKGMAWPEPRFTDNLDGTVTDNMTDLVWMQDSNIFGFKSWYEALFDCHNFIGGWRLPNVLELLSLVDFDYYYPDTPRGSLPQGHPFTNPTAGYHWTSTTASDNFGSGAYRIYMWGMGGDVSKDGKAVGRNLVWCVRDLK